MAINEYMYIHILQQEGGGTMLLYVYKDVNILSFFAVFNFDRYGLPYNITLINTM